MGSLFQGLPTLCLLQQFVRVRFNHIWLIRLGIKACKFTTNQFLLISNKPLANFITTMLNYLNLADNQSVIYGIYGIIQFLSGTVSLLRHPKNIRVTWVKGFVKCVVRVP